MVHGVGRRRRAGGVRQFVGVAGVLVLLAGCAAPGGSVKVVKPQAHAVPSDVSSLTAADMPGMSRESLTQLLGSPSFSRRDGPGELAQYRAEACVLDIFLYPDETGDEYLVNHVEARTPSLVTTPSEDCLKHIIAERRRAASS